MKRRNFNAYCLSAIIILFGISFLYVVTNNNQANNNNIYYDFFIKLKEDSFRFKLGEYLVSTKSCKIADMNPFDPSIAVVVEEAKLQTCQEPLVYFANGSLRPNEHHRKKQVRCCYNEIHRVTLHNYTQWTADWTNRYSDCHPISDQGTKVTSELVKVQCKYTFRWRSKMWTDYFATVFPPRDHSEQTQMKEAYWKKKTVLESHKNPPSVLIIGIDSISRLHMIRSLPKTRKLLETNDFVEMKGYTKIGENTFPNMMAALGGMKLDDYPCWKSRSTKLDDCPFIWKNFSNNNYITGFIEDSASLANFNYMKTGFVKQPVDYYFRPLPVAYHGNLNRETAYTDCVGGRTQTDLVLNYIQDFVAAVKNKSPYFFWSWLTTLTHDDFNAIRVFDSNFKDNLQKLLDSEGNEAVLIFMSDHGYRFGRFRETPLGYYEESLPFFFIRIPPSLKQMHPSWYKNLKINSKRLTSPLDLHATLEDIVTLSSKESRHDFTHQNWDPPFRAVYSFFEETPVNRTCESSNIPQQYCRCDIDFRTSVQSAKLNTLIGKQLISEVNVILNELISNRTCIPLRLKKIVYVKELVNTSCTENIPASTDYLIALDASPSDAIFEARCRVFSDGHFAVVGNISRINSYQGQSYCVDDPHLKAVCYCNRSS